MKFKQFYKSYQTGSNEGNACDFVDWHFRSANLPFDDEGMPTEAALYLVNMWNKNSNGWKYWIKFEDEEYE